MIPFLEILLALPFVFALIVASARGVSRQTTAWLTAAAPLLGLLLLIWLMPSVLRGWTLRADHAWIPQIGLSFSLRLDGLAWTFAGLVLAIGTLIILYARYYLSAQDNMQRFFAFLLLFMGSMLGIVIAGNLLLLLVFWEMTSISSFLLIGFWHPRADAREGAKMALTITGFGGIALMGGLLLLGHIAGSYQLDEVLAAGSRIHEHPLYPLMLILILIGIFTKSAQFPFHFWLPHAMAAPTPVSAYLHSATMVKAGVFLLARLYPALSGTDLFFFTVSGIGAITLLLGAWSAIFQHDIKGLLAYSTISHLGLITLLFGLSTPMAVVAALFHILNHAVFKASLFMGAGIIDHETGTRDIRRLGGLRRHLPMTSSLAIIASLAMAGVPLLNGFLSKEMFFSQTLDISGHSYMRMAMTGVAVLAGIFAVAYSLRFVYETFLGKGPRALEEEPHEPPRWMKIPVEILVVVCLAVGITPNWTIAPILAATVNGTLGEATPEYSLALWHGFNLPLTMSMAGLVGGVALYFGLRKLIDLHAIVRQSLGRRLFLDNIDVAHLLARRLTHRLVNSSLQRSVLWLFLVAIAITAMPFVVTGLDGWHGKIPASQPMPLLGWTLWLILVACTLFTLKLYRQRLLALIVISGIGLIVSLAFVFLSAPDLALTQLLVELVSLPLLLLGLNYLPPRSPPERAPWRRWRDIGIAAVAGIGIGALSYAIMTGTTDTIAGELLARALPEGHGRNVVNVILVDFRGFDTLGEITVFGIAALIVHALLRRARMAPEKLMSGPPIPLPVPADLVQIIFPLTVTVSIFLFLRGHNAPGGGFIAGLVLAVPLLIQYVIQGAASVESRFGFDYARCIALGLLIAALTGLAPMLLGYPFLSSGYVDLHLPLIGTLSLTSAIGFDAGVYLVVFGGAILILSMLGTVKPSLTLVAHHGIIEPGQRSARTAELKR
ncbi:MAG: monovalent cation/H+ antiporter subunit A [Xanthomonadaceae bacterium]|nr:monovalent cation/H+ antiporter subunit A [Xanthomonadaceae bacterium]